MTNDEAIEIIECGEISNRWGKDGEEVEKMAIEALKQKPSISEDGTLTVNIEDGSKVSRVLVCGDNHFGGLYYPEQEPCEDAISRQTVLDATVNKNSIWNNITNAKGENLEKIISQLPPVNSQEPKTGHCKDCKYFEYDSVAKVDGIPLILAHEICSRWSDGCKTSENGYCFLFEPKA